MKPLAQSRPGGRAGRRRPGSPPRGPAPARRGPQLDLQADVKIGVDLPASSGIYRLGVSPASPGPGQPGSESPEKMRPVANPGAQTCPAAPRACPKPSRRNPSRVPEPSESSHGPHDLVATRERLAPSDFQSLVTRIPGAAHHISRHGTVPEHAAELIGWAESPTGPGLATVEEAVEELRNPQ